MSGNAINNLSCSVLTLETCYTSTTEAAMQSIKIVCGAGGLGVPEREHCFEERVVIFKMINNF